jgi:hypothetical protein
MTAITTNPRLVARGSKVRGSLDGAARCGHAECAKSSGCEHTTCTNLVQAHHDGATPPPTLAARGALVRGRVPSAPLRKANGLALPMGCPSLTSRGRPLAGGAEVLIRTSTDEGRVGRRYGIRMKSMTADLDLSLPSFRVPATGRSKEAACLMGKHMWWLR